MVVIIVFKICTFNVLSNYLVRDRNLLSRTTYIFVLLIVNIFVETAILSVKNRTTLLYKNVHLFFDRFFFVY